MRKKLTVFEFACCFGGAGDNIPVKVQEGMKVIAEYPSLYKMAETLMPGIAERRLTYVTLTRECVTIQVKVV